MTNKAARECVELLEVSRHRSPDCGIMRIQDVSHLETENLEKWVSFALLTRYLKIHTVRPLQIAEMAKVCATDPSARPFGLLT